MIRQERITRVQSSMRSGVKAPAQGSGGEFPGSGPETITSLGVGRWVVDGGRPSPSAQQNQLSFIPQVTSYSRPG